MREQKANDNGFPVVGKQANEQQIFPFDKLVEYDGAANKITINANVTINGDTNIGELDIDSGDAPKGQVLTANGQSGASWENRVEYLNLESESGNLTDAQIEVAEQDNVIITLDGQFYYKNSQSDEAIVFKAPAKVVDDDTIVEKVVIDLSDNTYSYSYEVVATGGSFDPVYDDELNGSSTNAPQTKVVYEALNEKADIEALENGQIVVNKSFTTKQVENVSEDSGSTQTAPFLFQGTGTNNNTTETPTAPVAKQLELRGNSVVVNQQFQYGTFANTSGWQNTNATLTVSNNVGSFTPTAQYGGIYSYTPYTVKNGHKYLTIGTIKGARDSICLNSNDGVSNNAVFISQFNSFQTIFKLWTAVNNNQITISIRDNGTEDFNEIQAKNICLIDLTQWFNGNIPQDILDHPEKFINYYQGSLAYNTGEIVDCNATELDTIEFNQWDEEWEVGGISDTTGLPDETAGQIRSKNFIEVIPNTNYYFYCSGSQYLWAYAYDENGNFIDRIRKDGLTDLKNKVVQTPNNCKYLKFKVLGTTYNHDICINLSWDGQRDGEYQPFVKHTYALGNDVLKAYDVKHPSGLIERNTEEVDLSELEWQLRLTGTNKKLWSSSLPNNYLAIPQNPIDMTSVPMYKGPSTYTIFQEQGIDNFDKGVYSYETLGATKVIYYVGDVSENSPSGTLQYKLAEPTTEQGTAFAENIIVDDYGTMKFVNTNGVPQGNKFFYPADYVLLMDDLNNYLDDNDKGISDLAFKSEISDSALAERGYLKLASLSGYDDTKTQTLKNIEGVFTWVDDE